MGKKLVLYWSGIGSVIGLLVFSNLALGTLIICRAATCLRCLYILSIPGAYNRRADLEHSTNACELIRSSTSRAMRWQASSTFVASFRRSPPHGKLGCSSLQLPSSAAFWRVIPVGLRKGSCLPVSSQQGLWIWIGRPSFFVHICSSAIFKA